MPKSSTFTFARRSYADVSWLQVAMHYTADGATIQGG